MGLTILLDLRSISAASPGTTMVWRHDRSVAWASVECWWRPGFLAWPQLHQADQHYPGQSEGHQAPAVVSCSFSSLWAFEPAHYSRSAHPVNCH